MAYINFCKGGSNAVKYGAVAAGVAIAGVSSVLICWDEIVNANEDTVITAHEEEEEESEEVVANSDAAEGIANWFANIFRQSNPVLSYIDEYYGDHAVEVDGQQTGLVGDTAYYSDGGRTHIGGYYENNEVTLRLDEHDADGEVYYVQEGLSVYDGTVTTGGVGATFVVVEHKYSDHADFTLQDGDVLTVVQVGDADPEFQPRYWYDQNGSLNEVDSTVDFDNLERGRVNNQLVLLHPDLEVFAMLGDPVTCNHISDIMHYMEGDDEMYRRVEEETVEAIQAWVELNAADRALELLVVDMSEAHLTYNRTIHFGGFHQWSEDLGSTFVLDGTLDASGNAVTSGNSYEYRAYSDTLRLSE